MLSVSHQVFNSSKRGRVYRDVYPESSGSVVTQEETDIDIGDARLIPVYEEMASRARRSPWKPIRLPWR